MNQRVRVDEVKFTSLINKKMKEHEGYKAGMGVETTPNSPQPRGYTVIGGVAARSIAAWAYKEVCKEYEFVGKHQDLWA